MKLSSQQSSFYIFHLINLLIENKCYIKDYSKGYRAMDENHSPIINISEEQFGYLNQLGVLKVQSINWGMKVSKNPFSKFTDITLKKQNNAV